jgi:alpha-beta hydrolase superfamily lysophospholipase
MNVMEVKKDIIIQKDGYKTELYQYYSEEAPKACMLILHGMAEHKERYYPFVQYLNANGIDAYIYDHRGHGTDKTEEELGFFDNSNGYIKVVEDVLSIISFIEQNKRCSKFILMGHSMGSLIARNVIQKYDKMDGVIICGTTHPPKIKLIPGLLIASLIKLFYGPKHRSRFINQLMFGGSTYTNTMISTPDGRVKQTKSKTPFDWLTRNQTIVDNYIKDPYCGFICTISFYQDLINLTLHASNTNLINHTRKNLPISIISGSHDPVGNDGKETTYLYNLYNKLGFSNISYQLYIDCRHELLQELNSDEVMKNIVAWVN